MIFQTSQNINLFYETYGDKANPAVLLLHGLGADHQMWKPQIDRYPQAGLFVIAPDLRGHGQSSLPETFCIRDCAHDMYELLETLQVAKAHVIGVSMGGMVAQQLAVDYPNCVATLTVVDSLSGVTRLVERFNAWLAAVLLAVFPTRMQISMIESTYKKMGKADVGAYLTERLSRMDNAWVRHMRQQVNAFNICDRLSEICAPTLVLVGDRFGALAVDMARTTAEGIAAATFQVLPGGGDPSNLLVPEAFDSAVLEFVRHSTLTPS
jgi:3-oxoadipate enol-lactonase